MAAARDIPSAIKRGYLLDMKRDGEYSMKVSGIGAASTASSILSNKKRLQFLLLHPRRNWKVLESIQVLTADISKCVAAGSLTGGIDGQSNQLELK